MDRGVVEEPVANEAGVGGVDVEPQPIADPSISSDETGGGEVVEEPPPVMESSEP
jgi:hypothetical protein